MRFASIALVVVIGLFLTATPAKAIVFLPALVLIPIAKVVSLVIGGLAFPFLGGATVWSKISKKPLAKALIMGIILLLVIAGGVALWLKVSNPDRPWI